MNETAISFSDFALDIKIGLSQRPKQLSSKYFYNAKGDILFQKIMDLDEYYLTRSELEILTEQKEEILRAFLGTDDSFRLVELGAGDGTKTKVLLESFCDNKVDFAYSPIDISQSVLDQLEADLRVKLPSVRIEPIQGDYFEALRELKRNHDQKEVVLFLGSTIGNFNLKQGIDFLKQLGKDMSSGDLLFIGFDLKKDPQVILNAYNDSQGITAEFNLNLLDRINNELGGNFDRSSFTHYPTYDPFTGEAKSYLISKREQSVYIEVLDQEFEFAKGEAVFTEISQKYSLEMIDEFAIASEFETVHMFFDEKGYFVDVLWKKT